MDPFDVVVPDEAALGRLAADLAAVLPARAWVALSGDLGAGKTTLVKAVAAAVGIDPAEVVSPTFGLVHEHGTTDRRLVHADMYRLADPDDLRELGWEDLANGPGWRFVEWPERIGRHLPADRLDVTIEILSPVARRLRFRGRGPDHAAALDRLASRRPAGV